MKGEETLREITIQIIDYVPKPKSSECLSAAETYDAMFIIKDLKKDQLDKPFDIFVQPSPIAHAIGSLASAMLMKGKCEPFALPSLELMTADFMEKSIRQALWQIAAKTEDSGNNLCLLVGDKFCMDPFKPNYQINDVRFNFDMVCHMPAT